MTLCNRCEILGPPKNRPCPKCGAITVASVQGVLPPTDENTIKIDLDVYKQRRGKTKHGVDFSRLGLAGVETLIAQGHSGRDVFDKYNSLDDLYVLKCDGCGKVEFMPVMTFDGILRNEHRLPICMHEDGHMHIIKHIDGSQRSFYLKKYAKWTGFYSELSRYKRVYGISPKIELFNELAKIEKTPKTWGPTHILWGTGFDHRLAAKWLAEGRIPKKLQPLVKRLIAMHRIGGF